MIIKHKSFRKPCVNINGKYVGLFCNVCNQDKPVKNIHEMQFHVTLSNQPHNSFVAAKIGPARTKKDQKSSTSFAYNNQEHCINCPRINEQKKNKKALTNNTK